MLASDLVPLFLDSLDLILKPQYLASCSLAVPIRFFSALVEDLCSVFGTSLTLFSSSVSRAVCSLALLIADHDLLTVRLVQLSARRQPFPALRDTKASRMKLRFLKCRPMRRRARAAGSLCPVNSPVGVTPMHGSLGNEVPRANLSRWAYRNVVVAIHRVRSHCSVIASYAR